MINPIAELFKAMRIVGTGISKEDLEELEKFERHYGPDYGDLYRINGLPYRIKE